jgi:hypothetical protein
MGYPVQQQTRAGFSRLIIVPLINASASETR